MAELAVILGSGFSKPAGLPLAEDINYYFERDNAENILTFDSGEFSWSDFADEDYKSTGRLGYDHLAYGILLNEFVKQYFSKANGFRNYEDFYQFIIDNLYNRRKIGQIKSKSVISLRRHFPSIKKSKFYKQYTQAIYNFHPQEFKSMINHLIGDLLFVRKPVTDLERYYKTFMDQCKKIESIDFITLNHDLLLEMLINHFMKCEYSDGFSNDQNILRSLKGETLNLFDGSFDKRINIIKLHGSIDIYRYAIATQKDHIIVPTGGYLYFKTDDYDEKQSPERYDPKTGEKVQTYHWEIDPQFITGTRKEEAISQPGMYKTLYEESEKRLLQCKTLIIIGYSFGDEHVNKLIESSLSTSESLRTVINVNPSIDFPYASDRLDLINKRDIAEVTMN